MFPTHVTISLLVPARNEAANLKFFLADIPAFVDEVILIDGESSDETVQLASKIRPDIVIVTAPRRGKGSAIQAGIEAARGNILIIFDADGSNIPAELELMVTRLLDGADVVKGSRSLPGGGSQDLTKIRWLGNLGLTALVNLLFNLDFTDLNYGYIGFWRYCLHHVTLISDGFEVDSSLLLRAHKAGLTIQEFPSYERGRFFGRSSLNTFRDGWRVLMTILHEWVSYPAGFLLFLLLLGNLILPGILFMENALSLQASIMISCSLLIVVLSRKLLLTRKKHLSLPANFSTDQWLARQKEEFAEATLKQPVPRKI